MGKAYSGIPILDFMETKDELEGENDGAVYQSK